MKHVTHMLLIAAVAFGFVATLSVGDADAGRFYGGGCYRPSYNSYSTYSTSCYRPSYGYSNYCAPTVYRSTWRTPYYSSCSTKPCYQGGFGYGSYGYGGYSSYGYGGYGGCGFGGYQPLTNYGSYGAICGGYAVPVSYGYCGW